MSVLLAEADEERGSGNLNGKAMFVYDDAEKERRGEGRGEEVESILWTKTDDENEREEIE